MKKYISVTKESTNGIFWYIDDIDKLLSYPLGGNLSEIIGGLNL